MAGNPPAEVAQPSGINGMMVTVAINVKHEPRAPRIPSFGLQKPRNKSTPHSHSATPKKYVAPRILKTAYIQKIKGPWLMYGTNAWASYWNHF